MDSKADIGQVEAQTLSGYLENSIALLTTLLHTCQWQFLSSALWPSPLTGKVKSAHAQTPQQPASRELHFGMSILSRNHMMDQ